MNKDMQNQSDVHGRSRKRRRNCKIQALFFSLLFLVIVSVGGTMAYLFTQTEPIENTFTPSKVTCQVTENFNNEIKKNVNVKNTGDTDAYIRVKLVTYRVNSENQHIGGVATIPDFTPGTNWVKYDDYYYYTLPVAPNNMPATDLIGESGITLEESYTDADGGKQVIEVMAEAIQSNPERAVGDSWGVTISEGNVTAYSGSGN